MSIGRTRARQCIVTEYLGLSMKQIDDLRAKVREAGGEFHIVKNTLGKVAFEQAGLSAARQAPGRQHRGRVRISKRAQTLAKVISEFARTSEFVKIKGGYLEKTADQR